MSRLPYQHRYIVIAGLPASGKTALIKQLKEIYPNIVTLPESTSWLLPADKLPSKPTNREQKKSIQSYFWKLDLKRYDYCQKINQDNITIVCDTDWLTTLAYNYAERVIEPKLSIMPWLINQYTASLALGNLGLADQYIFLDTQLETRLLRRKRDIGRKRNQMFFERNMSQSYSIAYHKLFFQPTERDFIRCVKINANNDSTQVMTDTIAAISQPLKPVVPLPENFLNILE